jgi:hypothetical protein
MEAIQELEKQKIKTKIIKARLWTLNNKQYDLASNCLLHLTSGGKLQNRVPWIYHPSMGRQVGLFISLISK